MKKITIYEHDCKRCLKSFRSQSTKPRWCGKCKSPYWFTERIRPVKKAA